MPEMTKTAYAQQIGVHQSRVSQYIAAGMPVRANGRIESAEASAWIRANTDPNRRRSKVGVPSDRLAELAMDKAKLALAIKRIEYDRLAGRVVDVDQCVTEIADLLSDLKTRVLAVPNHLMADIAVLAAGPDEARQLRQVFDARLSECFFEASRYLAGKVQGDERQVSGQAV